MNWINFLHIYQPYNQTTDILEKVVNESYKKLVAGLKRNKNAKMVLNINGSLTELLAKSGHGELLDDLKKLAEEGQIEFVASAKYHSLLPLLPKEEVIRQIKLNQETNQKYFGKIFRPQGFFSPELAFSLEVAKIIKNLGFKWMVLDEIAATKKENGELSGKYFYQYNNLKDFYLFFRNRRVSNAILSAAVRDENEFLKVVSPSEKSPENYLITLMDGETFGHHRPGLEKLLFGLYRSKEVKSILMSDLLRFSLAKKSITPVACNWSSTEKELKENLPYARWYDPKNEIQVLQWQFLKMVLKKFSTIPKTDKNYLKIRKRMDTLIASDQFWWASAEPWWSVEMIEKGAYRMLSALKLIAGKENQNLGEKLYHKIIRIAFSWQRKGIVREKQNKEDLPHLREEKKIPLKKRVKKEWFLGLLHQLKLAEEKAAAKRNYERAIIWRDAAYKLKKEEDLYSTVSAVDLLREKENISNLDKLIENDRQTDSR